jgi:RHS repeat-associated protein
VSKTRVWGSSEKILLHFRVAQRLSGKRCWGCEERNEKVAVGSGVTYDYDAFGVLIHQTGTTHNTTLYSGEQFDPDLGLYFNRARYLNTSTGRFWTTHEYEGDDEAPTSLHKYYTQFLILWTNWIRQEGCRFQIQSMGTSCMK